MQTDAEMYGWDAVEEAAQTASAIAFDGCHKIYLAMDADEAASFADMGYGSDGDGSVMIYATHASPSELMTYLRNWYEDSCFLKFVNAVKSPGNNEDFAQLIPQGWDPETEEWA